jgi:hypothetical protein
MKTEISVEGWGAPASHQAGRLFSEELRDFQSLIKPDLLPLSMQRQLRKRAKAELRARVKIKPVVSES